MSDKYINETGLQTIKTWVESKIPTATLFWCTYDSTTYTEISTALTNGELPIVVGSGMYGVYSHNSSSTHYFVYILQTRIYYFTCDDSDNWGLSYTIIAPKDSPALTGTPTAPTATSGTNTTQIATTEFVQTAISEKQGTITANGILKGNGSGTISAAIAGTDYQTPLTAGTDYQTPLVAGTDYQTPLPSQSGNSGKFLTTNGSNLSWGTPSGGGGSDTYLCTYGTTTSAEISAALTANKIPYCVYNDKMYIYAYSSGSSYYFSVFYSETKYYIYCNISTSEWSNNSTALAKVSSPTLTGTPKAPTASAGTDSTQIATTAFVTTAISNAITVTLAGEY